MITEKVLALSWKQPYAGLMLPPYNKIETRKWSTNYRGLVLICASAKDYRLDQIFDISGGEQYDRIINLLDDLKSKHLLKNAHAIAIGRLKNCRPMQEKDENNCFVRFAGKWFEISPKTGKSKECQLYCLEFEDVRPIKPIPFKGSQKWKHVPQEIINQIQFL